MDGIITIPFKPRKQQRELFKNLARFNVWLCHRRFGKTVAAINLAIKKVLTCELSNPRVYSFGVTYSAVKKIQWDYLKTYAKVIPGVTFNESELRADFPNGGRIQLGSSENPDNWRGIYADFVILDEPQLMPAMLWTQVLRPALADRPGSALFIGTPGPRHGLFYDLWTIAEDDPDWNRAIYRNSETGIVPPEELRDMARIMSPEEMAAEMECVWGSLQRGSFYGEVLNEIEAKGQIGRVPHDPEHATYICADWGMSDATSLWFYQMVQGAYHFIHYYEVNNRALDDIVLDIRALARDRRFNIETLVIPHDSTQRRMTGPTINTHLQNHGFRTRVVPRTLDVMEDINTVRLRLRNCYFDAENCKYGIEALRAYRSDWDDKRGVLKKIPLHDWSSHSSDALRTGLCSGISVYSRTHTAEALDYSRVDQGVM